MSVPSPMWELPRASSAASPHSIHRASGSTHVGCLSHGLGDWDRRFDEWDGTGGSEQTHEG